MPNPNHKDYARELLRLLLGDGLDTLDSGKMGEYAVLLASNIACYREDKSRSIPQIARKARTIPTPRKVVAEWRRVDKKFDELRKLLGSEPQAGVIGLHPILNDDILRWDADSLNEFESGLSSLCLMMNTIKRRNASLSADNSKISYADQILNGYLIEQLRVQKKLAPKLKGKRFWDYIEKSCRAIEYSNHSNEAFRKRVQRIKRKLDT